MTSSHTAPRDAVLEVVHLVQHDVAQALQGVGARVDHVAEHLGGHHHDRRVAVDGVVACQQTDAFGSVRPDEVAVLLIRQRLQRGRVEGLGALGERAGDRVFGHEGLARSRRRGHEHRSPGIERVEGVELELVQRERPFCRERRSNFARRHPALVVGEEVVTLVVLGVFTVVPVDGGRSSGGYRPGRCRGGVGRSRVLGPVPDDATRPEDPAHDCEDDGDARTQRDRVPGREVGPAATAHEREAQRGSDGCAEQGQDHHAGLAVEQATPTGDPARPRPHEPDEQDRADDDRGADRDRGERPRPSAAPGRTVGGSWNGSWCRHHLFIKRPITIAAS